MKPTPKNKPRRKVQRVMRRLLTAVDRSILAAEEARKARDELTQLAEQTKNGGKVAQ